jgi:hypothetical protein
MFIFFIAPFFCKSTPLQIIIIRIYLCTSIFGEIKVGGKVEGIKLYGKGFTLQIILKYFKQTMTTLMSVS